MSRCVTADLHLCVTQTLPPGGVFLHRKSVHSAKKNCAKKFKIIG